MESIQQGIMNYTYRDVPMLKCPFDLALYMQAIWDIKPKTILEFGSKAGGSALWLADVLTNFGLHDCILRSYDLHPVTTLKIHASHSPKSMCPARRILSRDRRSMPCPARCW